MRVIPVLLPAMLLLATFVGAQAKSTVFVTSKKSDRLSAKKRRELSDSARDVREQINKRGRLETARKDEDADVRVTILDRRIEVNPSGKNDWGGSLSQTHYQSRYILTFRFETETLVEESEIALAGAFVTWKRVAATLAADVEKLARDESLVRDGRR